MSAGPINLITFNCVSSRSSDPVPTLFLLRHLSSITPNKLLRSLYLLENERPDPVGGRLSSRSDSIQFRQWADKIRSSEKYGGPRFRFYVGSHQRREARAFMPRLQRARRLLREREREGEEDGFGRKGGEERNRSLCRGGPPSSFVRPTTFMQIAT